MLAAVKASFIGGAHVAWGAGPEVKGTKLGYIALTAFVINLVVAVICGVALEGWGDLGSIVRVGANLRSAVDQAVYQIMTTKPD